MLYPDDSTEAGRTLRFLQQYFLVSCSLQDIVVRFRAASATRLVGACRITSAIQLNDTHPAIAVAELMRILLDEAGLGWDEAWDLTRPHARLHEPHAAAGSPRELAGRSCFEDLIPRQLEIIYEMNRRFLGRRRLALSRRRRTGCGG